VSILQDSQALLKYINSIFKKVSLCVLSALVAALIVSMDFIRQFGIALGIAMLSCVKSQVNTVTLHDDCHMIVSCSVYSVPLLEYNINMLTEV